ncbi:MAG: 50S ribosomal protein L9 [Actinomycetes bacterium]
MKLILTQEVAGLGDAGDAVEVRDGYGRNFLIPQGRAMLWTRGADKQVVAMRRARAVRQVRDLDHAREVKARLESLSISYQARVGTSGRLFGSVTVLDVLEAVRRAGGPELDRHSVVIPAPIKAVGAHQVLVRLHPEAEATLRIEVVPS